MRNRHLWVSGLALFSFVGCVGRGERTLDHLRNKPAPDFRLEDLTGANVQLSDFRGKPVVLAFWAYG